jgi:hypothetical protein
LTPLALFGQIFARVAEFQTRAPELADHPQQPDYAADWYLLNDPERFWNNARVRFNPSPIFSTAGTPIAKIIKEIINRTCFTIHGLENNDNMNAPNGLPNGMGAR